MVSGRMVSPSTLTVSLVGSTLNPSSVITLLFTLTTPAPIMTSASRREQTPAWAMYRLRRIAAFESGTGANLSLGRLAPGRPRLGRELEGFAPGVDLRRPALPLRAPPRRPWSGLCFMMLQRYGLLRRCALWMERVSNASGKCMGLGEADPAATDSTNHTSKRNLFGVTGCCRTNAWAAWTSRRCWATWGHHIMGSKDNVSRPDRHFTS